MNPIVFAIPVFMLTIVIEAWVARRRGADAYDIPDAITSLHHGVLSQVSGAFMKLATLGIYALVFDSFRLAKLPADSPWVWIGALIAYDFCYYWAHRMGHEVNVLWAAHVVHHSSEYYNLATALRQTSSGALLGWIFYLPLAVAGVPPAVFVAVALIDLLYQYWVHTELVGKLGWFDRVFVSPSNHRVHHGQNDYCMDRNYGGILILWDRLFGTFAEERAGERIVYGIRKPLHSFNPLWGNLHYYAELWNRGRAAGSWRARLGVWLDSPGGRGQPLAHFDAAAFSRFAPGTPAALRWYAAAQYALTLPFVAWFIAAFDRLSGSAAALAALGIFATTMTLGALLENRRPGRRLEQLRVVVIGIASAALPDWFGFDPPTTLRAAVLTGALTCAAWLSRQPSPVADEARA